MPERIQRKRTKGWKMPPNAKYVGRPGRWSNPFQIYKLPTPLFPAGSWALRDVNDRVHIPMEITVFDDKYLAAVVAVRLFELHTGPMGSYEYSADDLADLRREMTGRDLACWCPLTDDHGDRVPCHADALLRMVSGGVPACDL